MLFNYPNTVHVRRHGPSGYIDYKRYKPWLRDDFGFRCVYCLTREPWKGPKGQNDFGADHRLSQNSHPNRACDYDNLIYCCNRCNSFKQEHELIDWCKCSMSEHLRVEANGKIVGISKEGRNLIRILQLDTDDWTEYRRRRFANLAMLEGQANATDLLQELAGYPSSLPDLRRLRPPANSKKEGIQASSLCLREKNELPNRY